MENIVDVIVIGGGHAGVEAAYAAARMGSSTVLLTLDPTAVASMPCNPSLGGLGKGHIVYEVSAFGGLMPKLASKTYLQARMLNTKKGPAVQGLRLQIDKYAYSREAHKFLQSVENLSVVAGMALRVITADEGGKRVIKGVVLQDGTTLYAAAVVVTTGTFMNGLIHSGGTRYKAGRRGEKAVYGLSDSLAEAMGIKLGRLKTGTPPRILKKSIDYSKLERQDCEPLSYLFEFDDCAVVEKEPCYIALTNEKTHEIIAKNIHRSALYSGNIKGVGPRYCPSIEDKVGRYPDRTSHHVFVEPEGYQHEEIYPAGLSTSLPFDVQYDYIRSMEGFENAIIAKCGYAIEYDFVQPTNLTHTLEAKTVQGLFIAGQPNGTTGYEEAAGQGLCAGINAHLRQKGLPPFIFQREESYIGVMIDDLVTLGADEPYRMFTSRAERRLLLRQDNVFARLTPHAHRLGLVTDEYYERVVREQAYITKAVEVIKRKGPSGNLFKHFYVFDFTGDVCQRAREQLANEVEGMPEDMTARALLSIHAEVRYEGYLQKELEEVEKMKRYQALAIPADFVYNDLPGLTKELQHKLNIHRPATIAQAQLIQGITPAAISLLIFYIRRGEKSDVVSTECCL